MALFFSQSAFIGTTIALVSFKEEFNLVKRTAAESAFLSANIVSCYRQFCPSHERPFFLP
jgi:hypothetical protein